MDYKLELVPLPVADVDRAKAFYETKLGFEVDVDEQINPEFRIVQLTPPGSACSISFGTGFLQTEPGSVQLLHLVVEDVYAARAELAKRGVEISDVQVMGLEGKPSVAYAWFSDPDGNGWALQELPYTH